MRLSRLKKYNHQPMGVSPLWVKISWEIVSVIQGHTLKHPKSNLHIFEVILCYKLFLSDFTKYVTQNKHGSVSEKYNKLKFLNQSMRWRQSDTSYSFYLRCKCCILLHLSDIRTCLP